MVNRGPWGPRPPGTAVYSDAEAGVERYRFLAVFQTEISGGTLDGIRRMEGLLIRLQAFGPGVRPAFYLDGKNAALSLDQEVHLISPALRCPDTLVVS